LFLGEKQSRLTSSRDRVDSTGELRTTRQAFVPSLPSSPSCFARRSDVTSAALSMAKTELEEEEDIAFEDAVGDGAEVFALL